MLKQAQEQAQEKGKVLILAFVQGSHPCFLFLRQGCFQGQMLRAPVC